MGGWLLAVHLARAGGADATVPRLPPLEGIRGCAGPGDADEVADLHRALSGPGECRAVTRLLGEGAPGCWVLTAWLQERRGDCGVGLQDRVAVDLLDTADGPGFAAAAGLVTDPRFAPTLSFEMEKRLPVLPAAMIEGLLHSADSRVREHTIQMLAGWNGVTTYGVHRGYGPFEAPVRATAPGGVPAAHAVALDHVLVDGNEADRVTAAEALYALWLDGDEGPADWLPVVRVGLRANLGDRDIRHPLLGVARQADPAALLDLVAVAVAGRDPDLDRELLDALSVAADEAGPGVLRGSLLAAAGPLLSALEAIERDGGAAPYAASATATRPVEQLDEGVGAFVGTSPTAARGAVRFVLWWTFGPHLAFTARAGLGVTLDATSTDSLIWSQYAAGGRWITGTGAWGWTLGGEVGVRLWSSQTTISLTPELRAGVVFGRRSAHREFVDGVVGGDVPVFRPVSGPFPTVGVEGGVAF